MNVTVNQSDYDTERLEREMINKVHVLVNTYCSENFREIVLHQVLSGGKRIRPILVMLFAEIAGRKIDEEIQYAMIITELIHTYSLILDDIIDNGNIRRGKETTRKKYGDEMAILAAISLREIIYFAGQHIKKRRSSEDTASHCILQAVEGERLDILFEQKRNNHEYIKQNRYTNVSIDDYLEMIKLKTAYPIAFACKLGIEIISDNQEYKDAAYQFGLKIGLAFQIIDDVLDIVGDPDLFGKEIGKDIKEGKLGNYLILKMLEHANRLAKSLMLKTLRSDNPSQNEILAIINFIKEHKIDIDAKEYARGLILEAINILNSVFPNSNARDNINIMSEFIIERTK